MKGGSATSINGCRFSLSSELWALPETSYALHRLRLRAFSGSLEPWPPSLFRCSTRFSSWSDRARRCTSKSSRSDTSSRWSTRSRRQRLRFTSADRMLWAWLSRVWRGWRSALHVVRPETVIGWHRRGFRLFWTWKSRRRTGRPGVPKDVRALIRELSTANPLWGAPRIHGELQKLGIVVSQSTVAKYMRRHRALAITNVAYVPHATTPTRLWQPTSSSCRPSPSGCSLCSSSSPTTGDGLCTSR